MRLLPHIDWASLTRRPRALLGFSDVTALHAAASTRCELVTYHAPTARVTTAAEFEVTAGRPGVDLVRHDGPPPTVARTSPPPYQVDDDY